MTIAITGITGQLGALILERIRARLPGKTIIGLARSPDKAGDAGVAVRAFDYDDAGTLAPALAGVDSLMLVSSSAVGKRVAQHGAVIDAARAAGVRRIVYTSLLHADRSPLSLADEHRATEALLRESGLAFTILRNGWYTENYAASIPPALAHGGFIGSAGDGHISSAARVDYAEAAAVVLSEDGHDGSVHELAGDRAYTLAEFAAELARQAGRDVPYHDLSEADYAAALAAAGLPDALAKAFASYDVAASQGALFEDGGQLSRLIGRPTTPFSESIAEALRR